MPTRAVMRRTLVRVLPPPARKLARRARSYLGRGKRQEASTTSHGGRPESDLAPVKEVGAPEQVTLEQLIMAVYPAQELQPSKLIARALRTVHDALSAAQMPFFWVPGHSPEVEVLAVPASQRQHVIIALRKAGLLSHGVLALRGTSLLGDEPWVPNDTAEPPSWFEGAVVWRVYERAVDEIGTIDAGHRYGCEIEFWSENSDGLLAAPRQNRTTELVRTENLRALESRGVRGFAYLP